MREDKDDFFRQTTIRLCGSLEIERALWSFFLYIKQFIPADQVTLNVYNAEAGVIEVVASASANGGETMKSLIPLTEEARSMANVKPLPELLLVNRLENHPIFRHVLNLLDGPEYSLLLVRLIMEGHRLGGLTLLAKGHDRFTEEHLNMLSVVRHPAAIALSNYIRYRELRELKDLLSDDNRYLLQELRQSADMEIVGSEFGLKSVFQMVRQVAPLMSPVLLIGETGTGKEVIANAIHNLSQRNNGPFIKVNCGAIPNTLLDSELFGYERGAFTGAVTQRRGRFERANRGTIFLDEIGELTPDAQVRLLRVLQEKEIERVGGTQTINVDIRVIAATHQDIEDMVKNGIFRKDLFFRLNVFPIIVPPLRERCEDIPALVHYFFKKKARELNLITIPRLSSTAIDRLLNYHWPGNVRELENVIERALIMSEGRSIDFTDLVKSKAVDNSTQLILNQKEPATLDEINAHYIRKILAVTKGKIHGPNGAARLLGIHPSTLRARMEKLNISYGRRNKPE